MMIDFDFIILGLLVNMLIRLKKWNRVYTLYASCYPHFLYTLLDLKWLNLYYFIQECFNEMKLGLLIPALKLVGKEEKGGGNCWSDKISSKGNDKWQSIIFSNQLYKHWNISFPKRLFRLPSCYIELFTFA